MIRKIAGALFLTLALGTMVSAQDTRIEISPFFGYTFSEGFTVNPDTVAGIIVDKVNPTSGVSYGVLFNVNLNENMQVGFLFDNQDSDLELKGRGVLGKTNVADMKVRNYHGIFTYNWGDSRDSMRPYLFGGLGATQYSPGDVMGFNIEGRTKFSSTWGGGVKFFASPHFAVNVMGRWTPISNRIRAASGAHRFGRADAGSSRSPTMLTSSSSRAASPSLSRPRFTISGPRPPLGRDVGPSSRLTVSASAQNAARAGRVEDAAGAKPRHGG